MASKILLTLVAFVTLLVGSTYLWQARKLQYHREMDLTVAMVHGEITRSEYEKLAAKNTLFGIMFTEPA